MKHLWWRCGAWLLVCLVPVSIGVTRASLAASGAASGGDGVLHWNAVAVQAVVADHSGTFGAPEQGGPTRTARALAIVQIAVYDAVNAIDGSFTPYVAVAADTDGASMDAAIAQAAHDALVAMYPAQASVFDSELTQWLQGIPVKRGRATGMAVGSEAAANIVAARAADGSLAADTPVYPLTQTPPLPGEHREDPLSPGQGLLTPGWGQVATFTGLDVTSAAIRISAPPALGSAEYAAAFLDVAARGGDGVVTSTIRTPEETEIGLFWAYDGTNGLGTPPVLYNRIVQSLARAQGNTLVENARLFALVNIAMADAGTACWDGKYFYNLWRPIVGIRNAAVDGNPDTTEVADWTPLGAPASNQSGRDFTPPFPSYASGHATFGAATFRTLGLFYGTDAVSFKLKSDEMSGRTTDSAGTHRHSVMRSYDSFSAAAAENARSRIYLGIHWQFDADAGIEQGNTIADIAFATLLQPASPIPDHR